MVSLNVLVCQIYVLIRSCLGWY